MTLYDLFTQARAELGRAGISKPTATLDAELLARHALGWDRATWLLKRNDAADARFEARYAALIERRRAREPVAYIRGEQEFWGRSFLVTPAVLIPRPETELTIEAAAGGLADRPEALVVDVGTGSGCIAVTLALEHPRARVYATDVSEDALAIARTNADRLGAGDRVRFRHGPYLAGVPRPIDLIVSNPPYVAARDAPALSPEVKEHEPAVALYGGDDGLRHVRALLEQAHAALAADGQLIMEVGFGQDDRVAAETAAAGLAVFDVRRDLQGIPRVLVIGRATTE